jgi:hypothetical protein
VPILPALVEFGAIFDSRVFPKATFWATFSAEEMEKGLPSK